MKISILTICFLLSCIGINPVFSFFWRRRRRRRRQPPRDPPCTAVDCQVGSWSGWGSCSRYCGTSGTQIRTRPITSTEKCGGRCPHQLQESKACNRGNCQNGGTPNSGGCSCRSGYEGTCCTKDLDECLSNPCEHDCMNTPGSYTCKCRDCYTKLGRECHLGKCEIDSQCHAFGTVNPSNQCQNCNSNNKFAWTNNDALPCSDGVACTKNDRCSIGFCSGTPFSCLPCEECYNDACRVKPGHCVISESGVRRCFSHGELRPGHQCQECDSNINDRWTNNNNLKCNDNNLKTKDDRCRSGTCVGTPYNCLSCEAHNGNGCPVKPGYCIIQQEGPRTCYATNHYKPGNPCQRCDPSKSTSTWSNRDGVACNDGNLCTRTDTCQSGQCIATPFNCNSDCQYCNGKSCSLKTGFGFVNSKCMCKIAGRDYSHLAVNPSNQCQWCDLYDTAARAKSAWSNRPPVSCDDGKDCTKQDMCNSGKCIGQGYSCQASYPSTSCIQTSQCVGDGSCRAIMRLSGTICRPALDACDRPERCDGSLGSCPGAEIDSITLTTGTVKLSDQAFQSDIHFQYHTDKLYLQMTGFSISCGRLTLQWFILPASSACSNASSVIGTFPNNNLQQALSGLNLQDNSKYKVAIQASDIRNNNPQLVCSGKVTIDTSIPKDGWIHDGAGADLSYQASKFLQVNWGGFQTRHGVAKYEWKVLLTSFNSNQTTELTSFTNANLNTNASKTLNSVTDGLKVTFVVRAFTKAGLFSDLISDGVIIDTSPPVAGTIYDGSQPGVDLKYAKWTTTYTANWDRFRDPHSPISGYTLAIQRLGAGLITSFKTTAMNRSPTATNLNLVSQESYCAVVRGYNKAGLYAQVQSDCVLIDHDAPHGGVVNDGHLSDIDYQSNTTLIAANWYGFSDGKNGSGIVGYKYKVVTENGSVFLDWTSVGNATSFSKGGLLLRNNTRYFVIVNATDGVGLSTTAASDGVLIDTSHQIIAKIYDGSQTGSDAKYATWINTFSATWEPFLDIHSFILEYTWAVYHLNVGFITQFTFTGLNRSGTAKNLKLVSGEKYCAVVRGYNKAILYSERSSDCVLIDRDAPQAGTVNDGSSRDVSYQVDSTMIAANWHGFTDGTKGSGIVEYRYSITDSCGRVIVPWTSAETAKSIIHTGLSLTMAEKYFVSVMAIDAVGLTAVATSNGVIVTVGKESNLSLSNI